MGNILVIAFLGVIVFLILGVNFFASGGVILLDYVATSTAKIDIFQNAGFLVPQLFATLMGYELGTKGVFIGILVSAIYVGYLFSSASLQKNIISISQYAAIIGGTYFVINPFAYERMMVQPVIYLGIILIGFTIYHLLFGRGDSYKRWLIIGITSGLAINLFLHASFMVAGIIGLYALMFVRTKKEIYGVAMVIAIIMLLNINWIIAPLFGISNSVSSISSFSIANLEAFRTQALAPLDVWGTNMLLYGFWGERYGNHYASVAMLSSLWYVAGILVLCIILFGYYRYWKDGMKKEVIYLLVLGGVSLIFGIGIASPITAGLTEWMIEYIPLWQGYREPQKWIGILMIVEGIGLILGLRYILSLSRDIWVQFSITVTLLLLLLIWSPGPLLGYHGQLRTTIYPEEFEQVRQELLSDSGTKVLALPWHSYLGCSWTGRPTISNPISGLLGGVSVIVADNIEVGDILYTNASGSRTSDIEGFIHDPSHPINSLERHGISHILMMEQCADSRTYYWLASHPDCQKASSSSVHTLYNCRK